MQYNTVEPSKEKKCWVLFWQGEHYGRHKVVLREYEFLGGRWQRTPTPEESAKNLYTAWKKADWIGRLPNVGNKRPVLNGETLRKVQPHWMPGISIRLLAKNADVTWRTAKVCAGVLSKL